MSKKRPWYLRKGSLYFFCLVTPPIGYIIVISNLKKFEYEDKLKYLAIATIMASIWVLKFLPKKLNLYIWIGILAVIIASTVTNFIDKMKNR